MEIYCLQAALTPTQYWRQVNLNKIEQYSGDKTLKYEAASKLLSLSQDAADPQVSIDLLLSEPIRLNNPDLIERAIPILCKAVKDRSSDTSDKDVTDYLESLAQRSPGTNRDGLRCQIRLLLACSLVTKDPSIHANSLKQIAQICDVNPGFEDDTEALLDAVVRNTADADLRDVVSRARNYLTLPKEKPGRQLTQKS